MVQFKSLVTLARINQIKLNNYAKKDIHGRQRSFQKSWYRGRDWLEYSVEADAAFCFPCRKYLCNPSDEFGQTGFRNWKNALAAKKGLLKHESSKAHLNSITIWHDKNQNINNGTVITKMLGGDQINRNQYYIKSIFDLMLFLSVQELPFRGTDSTNITDAAKDEIIIYSSELFIAMFSYTIQKDPELNKIMKFIPQNAQYTSPQIQNEVISIMADMVLEHISDKYNKSEMPFFCLKADETKDASGCENLSIIIRYIFSGEIQENLIGIINLECLSAESITDCILKQLNDLNINSANIISQAYDGANVMSGQNGGVQTLLQKKINKNVPFIHCYNHKLHLVVQNWRFNVSCKYTGHTLKRLLD
ncbi:zinc finger protein 862-like [Gordionus sp. m RMFG-2023]|uniref:zinc finger protein 862-like n=1 Tax=Gordionus sp. m RMFG-2023 TaxID=3053472 RepID=UPI0031FDBAB5